MPGMLRRGRFAVALLVMVAAGSESSAQVVVAPPTAPPRAGLRSLGREFVDQLRYPFSAIPESFAPDPPPRVVFRPRPDGTTVAVPVGPRPVRPLYISGYAGARPPAPRAPLFPSMRRAPYAPAHGFGPFGRPSHHAGH